MELSPLQKIRVRQLRMRHSHTHITHAHKIAHKLHGCTVYFGYVHLQVWNPFNMGKGIKLFFISLDSQPKKSEIEQNGVFRHYLPEACGNLYSRLAVVGFTGCQTEPA